MDVGCRMSGHGMEIHVTMPFLPMIQICELLYHQEKFHHEIMNVNYYKDVHNFLAL